MTDLHLHDSIVSGDLHIYKSEAFETAWRILKEEVQEEPPEDPVMPKPGRWQRTKDWLSDFAATYGQKGGPMANMKLINERKAQRHQDRLAQFEQEQQALQAQQDPDMVRQPADASQTHLAQVFGHEPDQPDDQQMTLDQFAEPPLPDLFSGAFNTNANIAQNEIQTGDNNA